MAPGAETIAFVPVRYGTEVVGGAETLTRLLVEELDARGWPVEVLTTCALDPYSWTSHFAAGEETLHGITVRRFPTESRKYTRKVFKGSKLRRNERYTVRYDAQNAIVEVGPKPKPRRTTPPKTKPKRTP